MLTFFEQGLHQMKINPTEEYLNKGGSQQACLVWFRSTDEMYPMHLFQIRSGRIT
jgi:hypothetical protein